MITFFLFCLIENELPSDQYLCTGLDIYLGNEPDIFIAMAFVHTRIRRLFFMRDLNNNNDNSSTSFSQGAITGDIRFHAMRALNHRYRAFLVSRGTERKIDQNYDEIKSDENYV